jgi:hypothetical protein
MPASQKTRLRGIGEVSEPPGQCCTFDEEQAKRIRVDEQRNG